MKTRARATAGALFPAIRKWAGKYLIGIYPTGSFKKGTGIIGTTDIDLFLSLNPKTPGTLANHYNTLLYTLEEYKYKIRKQNVSIRVYYKNTAIDLVPARKQPNSWYDHWIYLSKTDKWMKTNVHRHIQEVIKSGRIQEICALKIWRKLHELEFPSFYLELAVIHALKNKPKHKLASNIVSIFEFLAYEFDNTRILDPANTNNIISDDLDESDKQLIALNALEALNRQYWHEIIW